MTQPGNSLASPECPNVGVATKEVLQEFMVSIRSAHGCVDMLHKTSSPTHVQLVARAQPAVNSEDLEERASVRPRKL